MKMHTGSTYLSFLSLVPADSEYYVRPQLPYLMRDRLWGGENTEERDSDGGYITWKWLKTVGHICLGGVKNEGSLVAGSIS